MVKPVNKVMYDKVEFNDENCARAAKAVLKEFRFVGWVDGQQMWYLLGYCFGKVREAEEKEGGQLVTEKPDVVIGWGADGNDLWLDLYARLQEQMKLHSLEHIYEVAHHMFLLFSFFSEKGGRVIDDIAEDQFDYGYHSVIKSED